MVVCQDKVTTNVVGVYGILLNNFPLEQFIWPPLSQKICGWEQGSVKTSLLIDK